MRKLRHREVKLPPNHAGDKDRHPDKWRRKEGMQREKLENSASWIPYRPWFSGLLGILALSSRIMTLLPFTASPPSANAGPNRFPLHATKSPSNWIFKRIAVGWGRRGEQVSIWKYNSFSYCLRAKRDTSIPSTKIVMMTFITSNICGAPTMYQALLGVFSKY